MYTSLLNCSVVSESDSALCNAIIEGINTVMIMLKVRMASNVSMSKNPSLFNSKSPLLYLEYEIYVLAIAIKTYRTECICISGW